MLGWVSGIEQGRGWHGCLSLPRILSLDEEQNLIQAPAPELEKLRGKHVEIKDVFVSSEDKKLDTVSGDTMEIVAEFAVADAEAFGLKVRQSEDGRSAITMRYARGSLNVAGTEVPLALAPLSKTLTLHVFVDKSVLEVFINDGETSVTRVEYPGEEDLGVSVFAEDGGVTLTSLEAWEMKSIW